MTRTLPAVLLATALVAASCTSGSEPETASTRPRVMVLGIDGGTWDVMDPMIRAGELPNIAKLYENSVHGVLESRPPALSPVVWTTIFTGHPHEEHGVVDWKHSQSSHRKVKAVWEIADSFDRMSFILNVPGSWPPTPVSGAMLAGFPLSGSNIGGNTGQVMTLAELRGGDRLPLAYTENVPAILAAADGLAEGEWSDWFDATIPRRPDVRGIMRVLRMTEEKFYLTPFYRTDEALKVSTPLALRDEVEERLGERYIPEGPGWSLWNEEDTPAYLYKHLLQVFDVQSAAAELFAPKNWDLYLYVMTFTDRISHPYWAYANPEDFPELDRAKAGKYKTAVADSYKETDRWLGRIIEAAGKDNGEFYVVLASDHGFQSNRDTTKPVGTHHFDGIYLVAGPGISGNHTGERAFIEDIAPTVLYLLGLPSAQDIAGEVIDELPGMLGRSVEKIQSYENVRREGDDQPVDAETWKQLCGLGYVECEPDAEDAAP